MVIRELSAQYHNTTAPRIKSDSRAVKSIRQALNDAPPPTHPQFSAQMAQLNDAIHQWDDTYNKSKQSKIHRCLIQKTNIKKTLNEAANPTEHRAASLKDPNTGKLTCDTKRLTECFSDTLLTLGGPLNYEPSAHTAEELLQHTPKCPPTTAITPTPEISWHRFTSYLHSCKPSKAGGRDSTNGYLFHISPEAVKRFLLSVCSLHLTNDMPDEWLEANVVLLYKKGPPHDPVNYRPIALLNTLYKMLATHAAKHLYEISSFYGLIHKAQLGGLPYRRCSDHIFQLLAKYQNCPASYSLYIDFNKAFNSVPDGSLFKTLEHYRLPSPLIRLIRGLYRAPRDYPVVNGHTSASHLQTRGVCQGCPLSQILFVLYVNVLLFAVPHHVSTPITQHESSHAFVDDLLYRSESSQRIQDILSFYNSKGRAWGLDINVSKTELHSMGKAPQTTITAPPGKRLSTIDPKTLAPQKVYKHLGVHLFTDPDPTITYELAKSEITSFSTFLHPLNITLSEYIRLVNLQLIPTLQYRLMAHPLEQSQLHFLQNIIWKNIAIDRDPEKSNRISRLVSNRDKYTPRPHGGLDGRHFQHCLNISTVNADIHYLNNEGPDESNQLFQQAALNEKISMVLKLVSDACHSLQLRFNTTNSEINTPPHLLQKNGQAYVRFTTYRNNRVTKWGNKQRHQNTDPGIHRGIVTDTFCDQGSIYFPGDDTTFNRQGSQKNLHPWDTCTRSTVYPPTPYEVKTSKRGTATEHPNFCKRPPLKQPGCTWMVQQGKEVSALLPPSTKPTVESWFCAPHPPTFPLRDLSTGPALCFFDGYPP